MHIELANIGFILHIIRRGEEEGVIKVIIKIIIGIRMIEKINIEKQLNI